MKMKISLDAYKGTLHRYYIVGCAVRDSTSLGFMVVRWYTDEEVEEEEREGYDPRLREKRLVTFYTDLQPTSQWGATDLEGWNYSTIAGSQKPKGQLIAAELDDKIYVIGSGDRYYDMSFLDEGSPVRGGVSRLKRIKDHVYVCGSLRSVAKMIGKNEWLSYSHLIPKQPDQTYGGFNDIDGFEDNDIYAVGGKGDVFRFDGINWHQIEFPSNIRLTNVCCGGDGNVYISGTGGVTFIGRNNKWTKISEGNLNIGFKDMVWFGDRVWCTNDYGVWTIHKNKVKPADLPGEIAVCAGYLSVADGVMLLGGLGGAAFMQNGKWENIYLRNEMEDLADEQSA
ncbi:hypothetical protein [Massilia rubra]|uniref:Uncharacterized protein n=1 Tax=Massilia rubra TaxID=2607910 RepID=A0ABX0LVA5_9BURK|nr:hypothetical protein [Massilia rubra]NHZ38472.1 hypothetical protein [Massilia rubra]